MWTVVDNVSSAEKSERVKSRVSLEHHVADRIDCTDCLDRLKECSPNLGNAVTHIKQASENLLQFNEQRDMPTNYLVRRYYEQICWIIT